MKKIITIILIVVLCNFMIYSMISFYELTLDVTKWSEVERLVQVLYGLCFSCISIFAYFNFND